MNKKQTYFALFDQISALPNGRDFLKFSTFSSRKCLEAIPIAKGILEILKEEPNDERAAELTEHLNNLELWLYEVQNADRFINAKPTATHGTQV